MASLKDKATTQIDKAREKADDALKTARTKANEAVGVTRAKTAEAVAATRKGAETAARKTSQGIDKNPIVAVLGGLAIGAIAAALIPKTRREDDLIGKAGRKVRDTAKGAAKAARETGLDQLDTLGVNAGAAKDQLRDIATRVAKAASAATDAATRSVRRK